MTLPVASPKLLYTAMPHALCIRKSWIKQEAHASKICTMEALALLLKLPRHTARQQERASQICMGELPVQLQAYPQAVTPSK